MTDPELLDALNALLPAQFEALLVHAAIPAHFLAPAGAPQATRAADVVRWAAQAAEQRTHVESALRKVRSAPAPAPPSSAGPTRQPSGAPTQASTDVPMTSPSPIPIFQDFGLDPALRETLDRIRDLLHGPTRNAVFPVVGSGLSQGLLSWSKLLEELIAQASPDERDALRQDLQAGKYIQVASDLEADGHVGSERIAQAIARHFRQPKQARPATYDLLAALPVDHFATTNFDPWLKDAVGVARGKMPRVYAPTDPGAFSDLSPQSGLLVLMLHGDADRPEQCVLASRAYRSLLYGNPAYRQGLEGLVGQRAWLFVGHSFSDPDLATLFEAWGQVFGSAGTVGAPRHFLLKDDMSARERRRLVELGIEHVAYGPAGDHSRLPDVLRYLAQPQPRAASMAVATSAPAATALASWERAYLGARRPIWQQGRHDVLAAKGFEVSLADLYVPLSVTPQPWCHLDDEGHLVVRALEDESLQQRGRGARVPDELMREGASGQPALAEQAVTSAALPFVVVQGEAGTGKTVLLQHIAYVLAVAHLTPASAPAHQVDLAALREGAPLLRVPVWLDAKRIAEAAKQDARGALVRAVIEAFADVATLGPAAVVAGFEAGRYLLLVDALDEVASLEGRGHVVDALAGLAGSGWLCRFVLTTRPTAHTGAGLPAGAARLEMAALSDEQVQRLASRWCAAQGRSEAHREALMDAVAGVRERHGADDIVENPMLLTSLFLVFDEERRLPDSTATLYDKMVDILCAVKPPAPYVEGGTNLCPAGERRAVLEHIFEQAQRGGGTELPVRVVAEDLAEWRPAELPSVSAARSFLDSLAERTYLLRFEQRQDAAGRPERFVLPRHRSVQEYLSACALAKTPASVEVATDRLVEAGGDRPAPIDDPAWTGSLGFLVGVYAEQGRGTARAQAYVTRLYAHASGAREARVLALVATALVEYEQYFRGHGLARDLPAEIVERFEVRGATWPWRDRVLALEALGRLGDPRLQREPWVEIEGGVFVMGGDSAAFHSAPAHEVTVARFLLSRWPVTVGEYRAFVDAGGYSEQRWWGGKPPSEGEPEEWRQQLRHPNRPVVGVSWHEAMAWCRWASRQRAPAGYAITLPTEEEWEFAARGVEGRDFPWGSAEPGEEDEARANWPWGETWPGRPTPVGAFPRGHCHGAWDMAGNVWEWTTSPWREAKTPVGEWPTTGCQEGDRDCREGDEGCHDGDNPCRDDDTEGLGRSVQSEREGESTSAAPRVVRGGSWNGNAGWLRCAARFRGHPGRRDQLQGFRVVCRRFRQHVDH